MSKDLKRVVTEALGYDVKIIKESPIGIYVKITSECPDAYFHIADNGVVVETDQAGELFVKRGAGCKLLAALIRKGIKL